MCEKKVRDGNFEDSVYYGAEYNYFDPKLNIKTKYGEILNQG